MIDTARIIRFEETGPSSVLEIQDEIVSEPKGREVRLKVQAIGLNRAEIMFREGMYLEQPMFPSRIGYEASGIVDAVGSEVDEFEIGDRVSSIPAFSMNEYGVYGEKVLLPADALSKYPEILSPAEGTSIWMQFITAYGALVEIGNLQKDQIVLITAASSSVGIAAIQMAKMLGAGVVATSRTSAKANSLREHGADHVIATNEEALVKRLKELTEGAGVDLVFDPIAGPGLLSLAEVTNPGGKIIEYGVLDTESTPYPLLPALGKGLIIQGYTLFEITKDSKRLERAKNFVIQGLKDGKLKPIIDREFPFDQVQEAHDYMASNQQIGKIVLNVT